MAVEALKDEKIEIKPEDLDLIGGGSEGQGAPIEKTEPGPDDGDDLG